MSDDNGPKVRTASGTVRGRWTEDLAVFRGVPFARPPIGALRFAAPRPPRPWDGVREAAEFGPPPPQSGPARPPGSTTGADWLTVNVWSPDPGAARLPVLVWFQGGAYLSGTSSDPLYDAALLARTGLVIVTFNYRVGAEGFAQLSGAPANRGLLDQIAALRWVRENIAGFGGDPGRVTVCGQSAGAGSIATLLAMPSAAGLFGRAIAQSVPWLHCTPALAEDIAAALAARLGMPPTAAALSAVDPQRLADEVDVLMSELPSHAGRWGRVASVGAPFAPVVDGEVLPDVPWRALADGRASDVALLTGHTRDEFRLFLVTSGRAGKITEEDAATALRILGPGPDAERAYRSAFPDAGAEELFELVYSDMLFRMPSLYLAEAHSAAGGTSHLYELCWPSPAMGGALGASHAVDVPLLFGTFDSPAGRLLIGEGEPPAEALALAEEIRGAWAAFARHGDPGWPRHTADRRSTRLLDAEVRTAPYPQERSRRIWEGHAFDAFDLT
ncbi:carboxylesterase/lipase family protein [Streptomyces syringium]|uniref:carboxylesterase/lipase family protein n=1 Tax=Streptomyces syringium TaxID=76729 RepID=UPI0037CF9B40